MKASTVIAIAAGLTAASAQIDQLPQCAFTCALTALGSSGCGQTDIKCICSASGFIAGLTPCVEAACSPADLQKTIAAATGLCASAGVSLSIPVASATSAAASASSVASSVLSSLSSSAASSSSAVYSSISSIASSLSSVYGNATITTHVPVPTGNMTVTTGIPSTVSTMTSMTGGASETTSSLPSPTQTGNAATRNAVAVGGLGAAVIAFAAALL